MTIEKKSDAFVEIEIFKPLLYIDNECATDTNEKIKIDCTVYNFWWYKFEKNKIESSFYSKIIGKAE